MNRSAVFVSRCHGGHFLGIEQLLLELLKLGQLDVIEAGRLLVQRDAKARRLFQGPLLFDAMLLLTFRLSLLLKVLLRGVSWKRGRKDVSIIAVVEDLNARLRCLGSHLERAITLWRPA